MNKADWSCDSCHTNNYAQESICRVCGLEAGSATSALAVPDHQPFTVTHDKLVTFVDSRHKDLPRPTIALAPVPPSRPALPKPPVPPKTPVSPNPWAAPPVPRPSLPGRGFWRVAGYLLLAIVAIVVVTNLPLDSLFSSLKPSNPEPAATPCPADAATWLPGNGEGANLVARYDTDRHVVTICLDSAGSYRYDGQLKGKPSTSENHIALPAERTSTGFLAVNGEYRYEISGQDLTVRNKGKVISQMHLTPIPS